MLPDTIRTTINNPVTKVETLILTLCLIVLLGALNAKLIYGRLWMRANNRGFIDWRNYRAGITQYPIARYYLPSFRRAYDLGMRQAQHFYTSEEGK